MRTLPCSQTRICCSASQGAGLARNPMARITVSDTGPGLQSNTTDNRLSGVSYDGGEQVSTGVGLANIKDRLVQAYGEDHRFETVDPPEGGFAVVIEIPFERRASPESVPEPPKIAAVAS